MTKSKKTSLFRRTTAWLAKHNWHKHPFVLPVVTLLLLFAVGGIMLIMSGSQRVTASDSHLVIFSHDKKQETLPTRAKTVGEFLDRTGVQLHEGDVVEPSKETEILEEKFRINIYRARPVTVVDNGKKTFAYSAATTARSVATQAGITVYPEDTLNVEVANDFIKDSTIGERVVIDRATLVNLNLYGTPAPIRTHVKTVGDLLKEKQITLAKDDTVQPSLDTPLTDQTQVFVTRKGVQIVSKEEVIAMPTETIEDARLSFGATAVRQQGSPGKRLVTYQIQTENGREVSRQVIQSVVAVEPVKRIVARGKTVFIPADKEAVMAAAGIAKSDYPYVNYIVSHESRWNAAATNRSSGAYGLCQALPGSKMATAGSDWQTNPVTQLRWCSGYANKYGGWGGAYNFWLSHHWW